MSDASTTKIPLPSFLKILTSNNVPPSKAMAVAGKIYKTCNTPEQLGMLSDFSLESAGVSEKDLRKLVLTAVRKAGYKKNPSAVAGTSRIVAASSKRNSKSNANEKKQKKRKRDDDLNDLLPNRPRQEGDSYGSLEFNEILDEEAIKPRYTEINRAPIMMAWAFIVAERLGFQREEALSVASVYTEMNAISKGVSLGIHDEGKAKGIEASRTGSQPYVELMGRRPLLQTVSSQWRALSSGTAVAPASAFSYIMRALRQTAPHIVGALRLLAASYPPAELNKKGFALYAEFRPEADGWGQRGQVRCSTILGLRKAPREGTAEDSETGNQESSLRGSLVKVETGDGTEALALAGRSPTEEPTPTPKKLKQESAERDEFDAALDADDMLFDDFDLSTIP